MINIPGLDPTEEEERKYELRQEEADAELSRLTDETEFRATDPNDEFYYADQTNISEALLP